MLAVNLALRAEVAKVLAENAELKKTQQPAGSGSLLAAKGRLPSAAAAANAATYAARIAGNIAVAPACVHPTAVKMMETLLQLAQHGGAVGTLRIQLAGVPIDVPDLARAAENLVALCKADFLTLSEVHNAGVTVSSYEETFTASFAAILDDVIRELPNTVVPVTVAPLPPIELRFGLPADELAAIVVGDLPAAARVMHQHPAYVSKDLCQCDVAIFVRDANSRIIDTVVICEGKVKEVELENATRQARVYVLGMQRQVYSHHHGKAYLAVSFNRYYAKVELMINIDDDAMVAVPLLLNLELRTKADAQLLLQTLYVAAHHRLRAPEFWNSSTDLYQPKLGPGYTHAKSFTDDVVGRFSSAVFRHEPGVAAAAAAIAASGGKAAATGGGKAAATVVGGKAAGGAAAMETPVPPAMAVKFYVWSPSDSEATPNAAIMRLLGDKYSKGLVEDTLYDTGRLAKVRRLQHPWRRGTHTARWVGQLRTLYTELRVLHRANYVHGDVRNWNLIFDAQENCVAWLLDFDFAKKWGLRYVLGYNWDLPERQALAPAPENPAPNMHPRHDLFALGSVMQGYTLDTDVDEEQAKWASLLALLHSTRSDDADIAPEAWPAGTFD